MKLKINELNTKLQTRAATNREVVEEYAELMKSGKTFPNPKVFCEKTKEAEVGSCSRTMEFVNSAVGLGPTTTAKYYLVDGFHRVEAMKLNGATEVEAEVVYGDFAAALSYALKANAEHGLRRTNEDKRRALEMAWEHREELFAKFLGKSKDGLEQPSIYQLAEKCCVSHQSASNFIKEIEGSKFDPPSSEDDDPTEAEAKKNLKEGKDRFGEVIPEKLLPAFTSEAPTVIRRHLRKAKNTLAKAMKANDVSAISIGQQVLVNIENALTGVKFNQPFCVCRGCHGEGCGYCTNVGFQTKSQYGRLPHEYKFAGAELKEVA